MRPRIGALGHGAQRGRHRIVGSLHDASASDPELVWSAAANWTDASAVLAFWKGACLLQHSPKAPAQPVSRRSHGIESARQFCSSLESSLSLGLGADLVPMGERSRALQWSRVL